MITLNAPSDWVTARTLFAPSSVNATNSAEAAAAGWTYLPSTPGVILGRDPQLARQRPADYLKVEETKVRNASDMLVVVDSKLDGSFDGNIDRKESDQWPSNRHQGRTVLNFADGHSEAARRKDIIDPKNDTGRRRWNNDNLPHPEITWTVDAALEAKIDP